MSPGSDLLHNAHHPNCRQSGGQLGFRPIPATGVIYVCNKAAERGWTPGSNEWSNLGQGQAETGPLPGGPPRIETLEVDSRDFNYSPVLGTPELREAVADYYNQQFRKNSSSKYTAENVAIASGGRAALTRLAACLDRINLGHFLPDYTAYEELIESFRLINPAPLTQSQKEFFEFGPSELRKEIRARDLGAVLLSNPSNPTGRLISGQSLKQWINECRERRCISIIDEFYSHYIWNSAPEEPGNVVSAARWIDDVNEDPIVIVDGLSKNWRYPGWRISWTLGPKKIIESIGNAGSFLDGGPPRPLQRNAKQLLDLESSRLETQAIQRAFREKRDFLLKRCADLGLAVDRPPDGGFYVFASVKNLKGGLSDGEGFFKAALKSKVITVPGIFFDINPGGEKSDSRFKEYLRLSFGPSMPELSAGLDKLESLIDIGSA